MLTYESARKIGVEACIDKLGRAFVEKHRNTSSSAYGDRGDHVFCFVGVNDQPEKKMTDGLMITEGDSFPYIARCEVDYVDGAIRFLDCILP